MSKTTSGKPHDWFDMYIEATANAREAGYMFFNMLTTYTNCEEDFVKIDELEHKGDDYLHELFTKLTHAFITPIDRDVMGDMMRGIDDITDNIEEAAQLFITYNIQEIRPDAIQMVEKINECLGALVEAMVEFRHYKKSKKLTDLIIEVNKIESEGDKLHTTAIFKLVREPIEPLTIILWKDIYNTLENVLDSCEDVADYMENISTNAD
jgi:predicted phosphate transport protein (TIGR00153 family)